MVGDKSLSRVALPALLLRALAALGNSLRAPALTSSVSYTSFGLLSQELSSKRESGRL